MDTYKTKYSMAMNKHLSILRYPQIIKEKEKVRYRDNFEIFD